MGDRAVLGLSICRRSIETIRYIWCAKHRFRRSGRSSNFTNESSALRAGRQLYKGGRYECTARDLPLFGLRFSAEGLLFHCLNARVADVGTANKINNELCHILGVITDALQCLGDKQELDRTRNCARVL